MHASLARSDGKWSSIRPTLPWFCISGVDLVSEISEAFGVHKYGDVTIDTFFCHHRPTPYYTSTARRTHASDAATRGL
jgi:hypothetical protein